MIWNDLEKTSFTPSPFSFSLIVVFAGDVGFGLDEKKDAKKDQ